MFFLCYLLGLASCNSFFKVKVYIDNPANKVFTVYIDGNKHEIENLGGLDIKLAKGEHQFVGAFNADTVFNAVVSTTEAGMLNLQNQLYVINKELYLEDESAFDILSSKLLTLDDYEINGYTYQNADFEIFENDTFIVKQWDYGVNQNYPDEFKANADNYAIVSKIFRIGDLEKYWGFFGNFDFSGQKKQNVEKFIDSLEQTILVPDTAH
ncbi:MAG: hypothetical protein LRY27_02740 [Chitinophagales bacterium]|nr:hypothetical protein [Chitinophagales bacterium]